VQNTKVRNSQGEFSVTPLAVAEEDEMARAVHGLKCPFSLLHVKLEHIILVVRPVTRCLPDADVVHVGSLNFLVAALAVLSPQKSLERIENLSSVGEEERTAWRNFIEEEKLLVLADSQVIALLRLLQELQMFLHLLLIGESNTADTLQRVVSLITKEICGRVLDIAISNGLGKTASAGSCSYLHNLEGLDLSSVLDVRASAKVDQGTASINGTLFSGDKLVNVVQFIFAVGKHFLEVFLRDLQSVEALLFLEDPRRSAIQCRPVILSYNKAIL
jgi:hypothetical protein